MCGIWMIASKNKTGLLQKDISMATQMMRFTSVRGDHSTGIAVTDYKHPGSRPKVWKCLGGPDYMIQNKEWNNVDKHVFQNGGVIFGHGRYATKGNVTVKNAHPFMHKTITLVHNGTLHSGVAYEKEEEGEADVEVDSHALCIKASQVGITEALTEAKGAFAVIVHDQKDEAIWFGRNSERTLFIAETSDRIFVMSEEHALTALLKRNYLNTSVSAIPADWLFKFDLKTLNLSKEVDLWKKKYPTSTYYTPPNPSYQQSWTPPAERRVYKTTSEGPITFVVAALAKDYEEYVYSGEDEAGIPIEFRTKFKRDDLVGMVGKAEVAFEVYRNTGMRKFVRFRDIEWLEEDKEADPVGAPQDPNSVVQTLNGKSFKLETWRRLIKSNRCGVCDDPIIEEDAELTVLHDNGSFICKDCVGTHTNYQQAMHPYAMGNE